MACDGGLLCVLCTVLLCSAPQVAGLSEPLEVPVVGDLIMLLASVAQVRNRHYTVSQWRR